MLVAIYANAFEPKDVYNYIDILRTIGTNSASRNSLIDLEKTISNITNHDINLSRTGQCNFSQFENTKENIGLEIGLFLNNLYYKSSPLTRSTEKVNNYAMFDSNENIMDIGTFTSFYKAYKKDIPIDFANFSTKFSNIACDIWSRIDENGNRDSQYWNSATDNYQSDNAWMLCKSNNCENLFALPYPKEMVLLTISFGCRKGTESVRYSSFVCEWVLRKAKLLNLS